MHACVHGGRDDEAMPAETAGRRSWREERSVSEHSEFEYKQPLEQHTATLYRAVKPAGRRLRCCLTSELLSDKKK